MRKKVESHGKGVMRHVRAAAYKARKKVTTRHLLPPPPSELRHTPKTLTLQELKREYAQLEQDIQQQEVLTQDHPSSGNHMADDASEVFEQTKNLALKAHLERMLEEVQAAMRRLERGSYGVCEQCGQAINPERLQVLPTATRCVDCARAVPHRGLRMAAHGAS